ncbi:MAG: cytochrome b [Magnetovibrio sp.]|nr:cytochrome b [Magnetovibrio sp.]
MNKPVVLDHPVKSKDINPWRNSDARWGRMAVGLHWGMAVVIVGLFGLGLWMTSLSYYDPWYKQGPNLHKSIGVVLFVVLVLRLMWRWLDNTPASLDNHANWERKAGHIVHGLLYGGLFAVMISGYLISTADGRAISVFGLFEIPATLSGVEKQEDIAGVIHLWLAVGLMSVAAGHALAALKHHFVDKDRTLRRMLGWP